MTRPADLISVRRPLKNPASDIRLLYLHAGDSDSPICCTISAFKLDQTPYFRAISYTWGPPTPEASIHLVAPLQDLQMILKVRENARYALWQARLHYPDSFVWIDSVCIDQESMNEKAAQVAMMATLYRKANSVLACIGPSDESSEIVALVARDPDSMIQDVPEDLDDYANHWNPPRDVVEIAEFLEHWNRFDTREYFSRLWIIQEVFGGKGRITMLCGSSVLDWSDILELQFRLQYWIDSDKDFVLPRGLEISQRIGELENVLSLSSDPQDDSLPDFGRSVLLRLARFMCQDPRDRVYGTLGLVDWQQIGVEKPSPDYSVSRFHLGLQLLPRSGLVDIEFARFLSLMLRLEDEIQRTDLYRRARERNNYLESASSTSCSWYTHLGGGEIHIVQEDAFGRLCLDLNKWPDGRRSHWADNVRSADVVKLLQEVPEVIGNLQSPYKDGQQPLEIFSGDEICAFAWPDVRPGDMIFGCAEFTTILRSSDDETCFQVVGKVLFLDGYSTQDFRRKPSCSCWPNDPDYESRDVVVGLSGVCNFDALFYTVLRGGAEADAALKVQLLSLDFPPLGSIMEDRTSAEWRRTSSFDLQSPRARSMMQKSATAGAAMGFVLLRLPDVKRVLWSTSKVRFGCGHDLLLDINAKVETPLIQPN